MAEAEPIAAQEKVAAEKAELKAAEEAEAKKAEEERKAEEAAKAKEVHDEEWLKWWQQCWKKSGDSSTLAEQDNGWNNWADARDTDWQDGRRVAGGGGDDWQHRAWGPIVIQSAPRAPIFNINMPMAAGASIESSDTHIGKSAAKMSEMTLLTTRSTSSSCLHI